MFLQMLVTMYL